MRLILQGEQRQELQAVHEVHAPQEQELHRAQAHAGQRIATPFVKTLPKIKE